MRISLDHPSSSARDGTKELSLVIARSVSSEAIQFSHVGLLDCFAAPVLGRRHSVSKTRVNALMAPIRVLAMPANPHSFGLNCTGIAPRRKARRHHHGSCDRDVIGAGCAGAALSDLTRQSILAENIEA